MAELVRYRSLVWDSARWTDFPFRPDDIVISTPPKSGTTWMQTLCAMLVLDRVDFGAPLATISPWLDMLTSELGHVVGSLEAQRHRRIIKTHTPLDGVPMVEGVSYVCVARDPRDVAMSFQHHFANLDLDAMITARATAVGLDDLVELGPPPGPLPDDPRERLRLWMDADANSFVGPSLVDVLHHVDTFWAHRNDDGVALFHYSDLLADLPGELRRLAEFLGIDVSEDRIEEFADAATFGRMKERADELVPDVEHHIWHSNRDFFHRGSDRQWSELLDDDDLRRYERRVSELTSPEVAEWAHAGWRGQGRLVSSIDADSAPPPDRAPRAVH